MKVRSVALLAAASVLTFLNQASAQVDFTPDAQRIISDPMYLPLTGQIYGDTSYTYTSAGRNVFDSAGAQTLRGNVSTDTVSQELQYGLTDDIALRANWGYVISRSASRYTLPGFAENSSSGWVDPDFGVTWRAIDQRDGGPFSLDLRADYSPDAFPAKSASPDDEGTVGRGGQALDLGLTLGHQTRDFTVAALFDANYQGSEKALNQVNGSILRSDSVWNYTLGLASQLRLNDAFSVNAGAGHTFNNSVTAVNETNDILRIQQPGDYTNLNVALNYNFVPNTVVGSIGYQHNFYDDGRTVFPGSPVDNDKVRDHDEDLVGVNLRYTFN